MDFTEEEIVWLEGLLEHRMYNMWAEDNGKTPRPQLPNTKAEKVIAMDVLMKVMKQLQTMSPEEYAKIWARNSGG
jgi:hypothetical protein